MNDEEKKNTREKRRPKPLLYDNTCINNPELLRHVGNEI